MGRPQPDHTVMLLLSFDPWFWDTCTDEQAAAVLDKALAGHIWENTIGVLLK